MQADLATYLTDHSPLTSEIVEWGAQIKLRATAYLTDALPPLRYISSVRAIVFRNRSVLVQQDQHNRHILPGGQREPDESPETTVRREVAEETGWSLGALRLLGFTHYRHLTPKPAGYTYPYPNFCWPIYLAEATTFSLTAKLDDGYEIGTEFLPIESVRALPLTPIQRAYLESALVRRISN
jgi:8-oxo-dGTP pyrophosphatase MutT (NUDIX family)